MTEPTPPRSPRLDAALGPLVVDDLDDDYPDLDAVGVGDETVDLRRARSVGILRSRLSGTAFVLPDEQCPVEGQDSVLADVDFSGNDLTGGWKRVRFERCRLMGCEFADAKLSDVTFVDCALDLSGFGNSTLERVRFDGCRLDEVTFAGTTLTDVSFTGGLRLATVVFQRTRNTRVDLRGAEIAGVDADALRGCTIDPVQLLEIAPRLAGAAGIHVAADNET